MTNPNVALVQKLLANPTDIANVSALCTSDVTYMSLNYENADLKKLMPWCGTRFGPQAIVDTFVWVAQYWTADDFTPEAAFGEGEHVAIFGRMTYTSNVLRKKITSPFSVYCRVREGKVYYMQFMEDTFGTSSSFRSSGSWKFRSNPNGEEVEVPVAGAK
jgi:ketosteroid isomerase-like protein